jgi:PPM family protein phosphatase
MVRFDAYSASNSIGAGHADNQDSFLADTSTMLFAVADGVGGYEGGKEASELAVAALRNRAMELQNEALVKSVIEDIHEELIHAARARNFRNMGTTIALAKILPDFTTDGGKILIGNVGDSPILLFRGSDYDYETVSTDDSFRNKMPGSMWAIVQYLGVESSEIEVHAKVVSYEDGDTILICSDGISDNLLSQGTYQRRGVGNISELVRKTGSARSIVEEAMRAGVKQDDMTAVLVFL